MPDLTKMISVGYVNEVDISKVKKGQVVSVSVDAFPDKIFTGQIIKVANIGQELKNQDAKVFEITIDISEKDDVLKPSMTTTNNILMYEYEDVISIPLEAIFSDSIDYVLMISNGGIVKQEIITGPYNEDNIIIISGVEENDEIILTMLDDEFEIVYLPDEIKQKAEDQLQSWIASKDAYDKKNTESVTVEDLAVSQDIGGGDVIFFN